MKFLIIRLSSLGDIIHSLPIVHRLQKSYPDAQIDWLVGPKGFELLELIPEINNVYLLSLKNIFRIQKQNYDYVIDVQGLFKSALLAKLSFGKKIIGFKNTREFADIFYDEKVNVGNLFLTKKHIVDLNLELISSLIKKTGNEVRFLIPELEKTPLLEKQVLVKHEKLPSIVIFPATTWNSKLWSFEYWFELIEKISNRFNVFICAAGNEYELLSGLIKKLNNNAIPHINLIGKTSVKDLIYLLQNVDIAVGLDSGGLHLASAIKNDCGKPEVIGLYGPTSLFRNGPYKSLNNCLYLSELECISCRKKKCPLGHHNCMNNIVPQYVIDMIYSLVKVKIPQSNMLNS